MGFATGTGKIALLGLFYLGYLGTLYNIFQGGLANLLEGLKNDPKLPGTTIHLRNDWTGILRLDQVLSSFVAFFSPILDGQLPRLSLLGIHFYGQGITTWLLILVEGSRVGNAWKFISLVTVWGLLIECVAMALAVPAWCLLHLLSSTTILHAGTMLQRQMTLVVHPLEVDIIPLSVAIGCGVPTMMVLLTDATTEAPLYLSQQFWILARLFHPVYTAISHFVLSVINYEDLPGLSDPSTRSRVVAKSLRRVSSFATTIAVVSHAGTMALSLGTVLVPSVFTEAYRIMFNPLTLFKLDIPGYQTDTVKTIAAGVLSFLQWDEVVTVTSILLWAFVVNRNALSSDARASGLLSVLVRTVLWTAVGGPAAAAVRLIKERDEFMLETVEATKEEPADGNITPAVDDTVTVDDVQQAELYEEEKSAD